MIWYFLKFLYLYLLSSKCSFSVSSVMNKVCNRKHGLAVLWFNIVWVEASQSLPSGSSNTTSHPSQTFLFHDINHLFVEILWHYKPCHASIWSQRVLFILPPLSLILHGVHCFFLCCERRGENTGPGSYSHSQEQRGMWLVQSFIPQSKCVILSQGAIVLFPLENQKGYLLAHSPLLLNNLSPN